MRDEDWDASFHTPDHDGGIYTAADAWCRDPAAAKARYGPIASWDTSAVTILNALFCFKRDFNGDISRWNVSNVVDMGYMLSGATSFNCDLTSWNVGQVRYMDYTFSGAASFDRQLGGAWSTSTARKVNMFYNSPGTIAGKTKDARGTVARE